MGKFTPGFVFVSNIAHLTDVDIVCEWNLLTLHDLHALGEGTLTSHTC